MPPSNVCWGIEVGAGAIKAIKLEATGSGVNVLDYAVVPHKKVLSTPDLDQADATRLALGEFVHQFDLAGARVAVSVPGHSAFARFAKLPPVEPKKVPDIVKFEAVQQIPFPIDDVEWDYQTFVSPDTPEVEVGIFAITRERIMERLALYSEAAITPDIVTLSPVALYNAVAYDLAFDEKTPGTILLDIGTTSTDLVVCEPGRVWIRTFPIGGHHFTEALVNKFQLSYPKAEKLKKEAESTQHARHVFQAMRPVFADLAQDVQRSIGYYTSLHKDAKLTRLIGVGATFRLPGLRKFLKQQLQLDVYRLEQFKRLSVEGVRAGEFQSATLSMGTAYGLALQGLGEAALDVNLMPVSVVREAMWSRKVAWFGVAAAVAIAASGAMFIRPFIDRTQVNDNPRPQLVSDVINRLKQARSEADDVTSDSPNLEAADALNLLEGRGFYAHLIADVGSIVAAAEERAKNWPEGAPGTPPPPKPAADLGAALVVKSMETKFVHPLDAADASGNPVPGGPRAAAIEVELTVVTTQPDAMRFLTRSVRQWLKDNAIRPDLPYTIEGDMHRIADSKEVPAADEKTTPDGPALPPELIKLLETRGAALPPQDAGQITITGDAASAAAYLADQKRRAAAERVDKLAPLPTPPGPPPGVKVATAEVKWRMVLAPPQKKEVEEGGGS